MFRKKKSKGNRFIVAVKNYNETISLLRGGDISLPAHQDVYLQLLGSQSAKADNRKALRKFIKESNKAVKDVMHYWEGLIDDGYTLVNVEYLEKKPSIEQLCNNDTIKFIGLI